MAQAAREGLVFCREPSTEYHYRHDGDVSNEWELVTLERLQAAVSKNRVLIEMPRFWYPRPIDSVREHHAREKRPRAVVALGSGASVHPGHGLSQGLGGGDGPVHS